MTINPDILDKAADYVEQNGWHQGYFFPLDLMPSSTVLDDVVTTVKHIGQQYSPPMCTMGAVALNCEDMDEYRGTHDFLAHALGQREELSIPTWNDASLRTKDEVIELLRMESLKIRMGNIGDNPREYEFEPMPESEPVKEPAAPQPVKEPQPA